MKVTIKQIESVVTPSGNSGHVVVPKYWIGKGVIVKIKQEEKWWQERYISTTVLTHRHILDGIPNLMIKGFTRTCSWKVITSQATYDICKPSHCAVYCSL